MGKLNKLQGRLEHLRKIYIRQDYHIPLLWDNPIATTTNTIKTNPFDFFLKKIKEIHNLGKFIKPQHTHQNIVYNMFVRYTAAFDHNNDGKVETGLNAEGFRETGTFLKALALLPYIHSLGCDTIYLLPVTSIGKAGKKGNLGSPYAIADPSRLDENLSEPILELSVDDQFTAFVEAAHTAGMKIVVEFVFRTASIDSPIALEHPDWFYWIRDNINNRDGYKNGNDTYGPPWFDEATLKTIKEKIENKIFSRLPSPLKNYRELFTDTPVSVFRENGYVKGITKQGIKCKIPSAFADWPPDDNQPVWSDVTYLKMYEHKKFNYIAYNTIRMYDTALAKQQYAINSLWEHIEGIIPYYRAQFDIDGVMIDMGHALPPALLKSIIKKARVGKPDFIIWEENFTLTKEARSKGFDASLGYLPFDQHNPAKMKEIVNMLALRKYPIPFFLTPETHNTKRAASRPGSTNFSKYAWTVNSCLPGLLFIHSGFELGETKPVNTGLHFSDEEISVNPPETLPLFSIASLNWNSNTRIIDYIRKILKIRQNIGNISRLTPLKSLNPNVIAIKIINADNEKYLLVTAPYSTTNVNTLIFIDEHCSVLKIEGENDTKIIQNNELLLTLQPLEILFGVIG